MSTAKKPATKEPAAEAPTASFATPARWAEWLAAHRAASRGVWLKLAKKASGATSVTYAEALEVALAWGWIDGQKQAHDDAAWLQKFTPRGAKSLWSQINRDKALALIASGAMMPPGLAEFERAKADGRWDAAYEPQSRATVPDDLAAALAANPRPQVTAASAAVAERILELLHNTDRPADPAGSRRGGALVVLPGCRRRRRGARGSIV